LHFEGLHLSSPQNLPFNASGDRDGTAGGPGLQSNRFRRMVAQIDCRRRESRQWDGFPGSRVDTYVVVDFDKGRRAIGAAAGGLFARAGIAQLLAALHVMGHGRLERLRDVVPGAVNRGVTGRDRLFPMAGTRLRCTDDRENLDTGEEHDQQRDQQSVHGMTSPFGISGFFTA
jgi:hypothetical protein